MSRRNTFLSVALLSSVFIAAPAVNAEEEIHYGLENSNQQEILAAEHEAAGKEAAEQKEMKDEKDAKDEKGMKEEGKESDKAKENEKEKEKGKKGKKHKAKKHGKHKKHHKHKHHHHHHHKPAENTDGDMPTSGKADNGDQPQSQTEANMLRSHN